MKVNVNEIIDELDASTGLNLDIEGDEFSLTVFLDEAQVIDLIFNLQRNLIKLGKVNRKKMAMDKKYEKLFVRSK